MVENTSKMMLRASKIDQGMAKIITQKIERILKNFSFFRLLQTGLCNVGFLYRSQQTPTSGEACRGLYRVVVVWLFDGHLGQCVAITHHEEAVLFCQQLQGEVCQGVFQYHITTDWGVATSTWLIIVGDACDDVSPP